MIRTPMEKKNQIYLTAAITCLTHETQMQSSFLFRFPVTVSLSLILTKTYLMEIGTPVCCASFDGGDTGNANDHFVVSV